MGDMKGVVARSIKAARAREREKTCNCEIEVTPEMKDAGALVLAKFSEIFGELEDAAEMVFEAMLAARSKPKESDGWLEIGPDGARGHIVLRPPFPPRLSREPKDPA